VGALGSTVNAAAAAAAAVAAAAAAAVRVEVEVLLVVSAPDKGFTGSSVLDRVSLGGALSTRASGCTLTDALSF
jgi:hypothetical protein